MKTILFAIFLTLNVTVQAMELGRYVYEPLDEQNTVLNFYPNGTVSYESTRQVGDDFTPQVPFPTLCRLREWGEITNEDESRVTVLIKLYTVVEMPNLPRTEHCAAFVRNANISHPHFKVSIVFNKSALKLVPSHNQ